MSELAAQVEKDYSLNDSGRTQSTRIPASIGWVRSQHTGIMAPVYARYEVARKMLDAKRVTGESSMAGTCATLTSNRDAVNVEDLPEMDFPKPERQRYLLRPRDLLVCEGG